LIHSINICEERASKGTIGRLNHNELCFFPYETKILLCERVNDMKTPTAYKLIRLAVLPLNATSKRPARAARKMIPMENARRSPLKANWCGRKSSRASSDARRGKSE